MAINVSPIGFCTFKGLQMTTMIFNNIRVFNSNTVLSHVIPVHNIASLVYSNCSMHSCIAGIHSTICNTGRVCGHLLSQSTQCSVGTLPG